MSAPTPRARRRDTAARRAPSARPACLLHVFLVVTSLAWLAPLLWAVFTSLRPYADTSTKGYVSWPDKLSFDNYKNAFEQSDMPHYFVNTLIIAVPARAHHAAAVVDGRLLRVAASTSGSTSRCCWSSRPATCCRSRSSSPRCTGCTC